MKISKITVLTVFLGLLLSFAWLVSPLSAAASDEKPEGLSVLINSLTPGQFKEASSSDSAGSQPSATRATCADCGSALTKLNQAYGYLSSALSAYDADYCDFLFYPDNVYGCIVAARLRTDLASDYASNAYNTCNCTSAQDALDEAQEALFKLDCAIDNTNTYCDSSSPWKNYLSSAKTWLNSAISKLNECVDEACN